MRGASPPVATTVRGYVRANSRFCCIYRANCFVTDTYAGHRRGFGKMGQSQSQQASRQDDGHTRPGTAARSDTVGARVASQTTRSTAAPNASPPALSTQQEPEAVPQRASSTSSDAVVRADAPARETAGELAQTQRNDAAESLEEHSDKEVVHDNVADARNSGGEMKNDHHSERNGNRNSHPAGHASTTPKRRQARKQYTMADNDPDHRVSCELPECDRAFATKSEMRNHSNSIHKGVTYDYPACPSTFTRPSTRNKHVQQIHKTSTSLPPQPRVPAVRDETQNSVQTGNLQAGRQTAAQQTDLAPNWQPEPLALLTPGLGRFQHTFGNDEPMAGQQHHLSTLHAPLLPGVPNSHPPLEALVGLKYLLGPILERNGVDLRQNALQANHPAPPQPLSDRQGGLPATALGPGDIASRELADPSVGEHSHQTTSTKRKRADSDVENPEADPPAIDGARLYVFR